MSNESCCCGTEAPKAGSFCQRNVGSIALIVGIIALGSSLVPQIQDFCGSSENNVEVTVVKEEGRPGPGGPGGGFGGGFGGGPGGGGPAVSEETLKLYSERIGLYDEALKASPAERQAQLRHERCLVRLTKLRLEQGGGGRRFRGASLAEAYLNRQAAKANSSATALERNQAELDYQRALDSFRGDKEAFLESVKAFEAYPGNDLSDAELLALLAAERG